MKKKFFFFDVDNTLTIWPSGEVPKDTSYCLSQLKKEGHQLALATGRLQIESMYFAEKTGISIVVADGGESLTINNEILFMHGINSDCVRNYLEVLNKKNIPWAITYKNERARYTPFPEVLDYIASWDKYETIIDKELDLSRIDTFYKVYVYGSQNFSTLESIDPLLPQHICFGDSCWLYEPMDKAKGVKKVLDYYGAPYTDAVVFGDGMNDLSLFDPSFINIAMGNAKPQLKEKADYVTDDCDKGGILKACKHFGWING